MFPNSDQPQNTGEGMPGLGMMPDKAPQGDLEAKVADLEARVQALEGQQAAPESPLPGQ